MEKVQNKESGFLKKLMTPLGFGTAIAVSAGLGFGLAFLRNKLAKPKSEYQMMIEKIKKRVKEEKDNSTYSDELIKMVYEAVPLVIQKDFNKISNKALKNRIKALEDIKAYDRATADFGLEALKIVNLGAIIVIKKAGGIPTRFQESDKLRRENSPELQQARFQVFANLREKYNTPQAGITLTDELVREVEAYFLELSQRVFSEKLEEEFLEAKVFAAWVCDHVYKKFGLDHTTDEYRRIKANLVKEDPEFKALTEESSRIALDILKRSSKRRSG